MTRWLRALALLLFLLGTLVGVAFNGLGVWADLEAFVFDSAVTGEQSLGGLSCPILMTREDQSQISARLSNPLDRPIERRLRFRATQGSVTLMNEEAAQLDLAPAETKQAAWTVDPDDAAWGRFVLARVYVYRSYPLPSQSSACGIALLDVPRISGSDLTRLAVAFTFLTLLSGTALWGSTGRPQRGKVLVVRNVMIALTALVLGNTAASLLGWMIIATLLWMVSALVILVSAAYFIPRQ